MSSYITKKTAGDTAWFEHDRFGMFIHFGLYALGARGEWFKSVETLSDEKYDDYFRHFDPRHEREEEIFTKLGYIDLVHLAPRIQAKLQMHTGLMDNICPPSTQFAMYNHLTCEKSVVIYPDYAHETPRDAGDIAMQFIVND